MERMIEGYLAFARGEGDEDRHEADLGELLQAVASRPGATPPSQRRDPGDMALSLRPKAIRRASTNPSRMGCDTLERSRSAPPAGATPSSSRSMMTARESRRHSAPTCSVRSSAWTRRAMPDTGGVGLGLAIARDIARSHGGDVTLATSVLGLACRSWSGCRFRASAAQRSLATLGMTLFSS